jgi:hypothetical protein
MTNDGDSKTENDESGKQKNNQHSAYDVEKSIEMEIGGGGEEEVIIPGT